MAEFVPHSQKQEDAVYSDAKITAVITGIQWGKSTVGAVWMKRQMHTHCKRGDNFLVTAPTYKILDQATIPAFLQIMEGCGEYNAQKATFKMMGGGTCYFRTGTDPDSVVGITNVRAVWGDEAGKYSAYFWDNIQARASFKDAPIMLTTSPYSLNWIYKDFIKKRPPHVRMFTAKSLENPYFPRDEWHRRKANMDPRRFAAIYGGEFSKMEGLVYGCFDEDIHIIDPAEFAPGTKFVAGIDWGFTEPFCLHVRAITPGGNHYQVSEVYRSGLTIEEITAICRQKMITWGIKTFYCGPDQPGHILQLNRVGCPAVPAANDRRLGLDLHFELIKSGRFSLFRDQCPYTVDEYLSYHYPEPEDLGPDDKEKDVLPVEKDDHAMDASRYCTISTVQGGKIRKPKIRESRAGETEDVYARHERLKRGRGANYEVW